MWKILQGDWLAQHSILCFGRVSDGDIFAQRRKNNNWFFFAGLVTGLDENSIQMVFKSLDQWKILGYKWYKWYSLRILVMWLENHLSFRWFLPFRPPLSWGFLPWPWSSFRIHQPLFVQFVGEIYKIIQVYIYYNIYIYNICNYILAIFPLA